MLKADYMNDINKGLLGSTVPKYSVLVDRKLMVYVLSFIRTLKVLEVLSSDKEHTRGYYSISVITNIIVNIFTTRNFLFEH